MRLPSARTDSATSRAASRIRASSRCITIRRTSSCRRFCPDTPACRAELAQYYESISRVDTGLGRLIEILKQAGKYDDTLIIYISDNGMPFPARRRRLTSPDCACRASCAIRTAQKRGVVSEAMVSWVDITPTILDFAGVEPTDGHCVSRPVVPADSRTGATRPAGTKSMPRTRSTK